MKTLKEKLVKMRACSEAVEWVGDKTLLVLGMIIELYKKDGRKK